MVFTILLALSGLTLSAVAIYYSVIGLTAIFAAAFWPIVVMGTSLEVSKLVAASWLKANWERIPKLMKIYMMIAVIILMLITSMGIFGFLSKAHSDQSLVSGDVQSKIAIYDEKIKTAKENIEANRKQLKQMDEAVDQVMARSTDEKGADKSNAIRRSQQRDRSALAKDIEANQKLIATLNDEAAPIRAEVRKVEAEVGPIKYIAAFVYGDNPDENILEKAVTWVIMVIIFVFDPMAVLLLLASQMTWQWYKEEEKAKANDELLPIYVADVGEKPTAEEKAAYEQDDGPLTNDQIEQIKESVNETPIEQSDTVQTTVSKDPHTVGWMFSTAKDEEPKVETIQEPIAENKQSLPIVFPENPFVGQQHRATEEEGGKDYVFNGTEWVFTPLNNSGIVDRPGDYLTESDSKKKDLHDKTSQPTGDKDDQIGYVQNSEQNENTLWKRLTKKNNE